MMPYRRLFFVAFSLLLALALCQPQAALSQSGSKQSSRKSKPAAKTQPEKKKPQASISDMQKEQQRLKAEAAEYENKAKKSKEEESATLANINELEKQISMKRRLIKKLSEQESGDQSFSVFS